MSSNGLSKQTTNLKFVKSGKSQSEPKQSTSQTQDVKHGHGHMTHGQSLEIEPT